MTLLLSWATVLGWLAVQGLGEPAAPLPPLLIGALLLAAALSPARGSLQAAALALATIGLYALARDQQAHVALGATEQLAFAPARLVLGLGVVACLLPASAPAGPPRAAPRAAGPRYVLLAGLLLCATALVVGLVFRAAGIDHLGHALAGELALAAVEVALAALVALALPQRLGPPRLAAGSLAAACLLAGLL